MHHAFGYSHEDIAKYLQIPENTSYTRTWRGVRKLAKVLGDEL